MFFHNTMSVHVLTSLVPVIRYMLQHTCSVYFSAHYDREQEEEHLLSLLERRYSPKKLRRRLKLA